MLASSNHPKMTGLELGLGSAASSLTSSSSSTSSEKQPRTSSSSDEMLTTPKVPDSALLSPRIGIGDFPTPRAHSNPSEMLTTPKPLELLTPRGVATSGAGGFSPTALRAGGSPTPVDPGPRVAEDLPLGPEIGLRSPCDGILARRRREYRNNKLADKSSSVNSDSNSCDTPNSSQNSPRDYTLVKNGDCCDPALSPSAASKVQVKLEFSQSNNAALLRQEPCDATSTTATSPSASTSATTPLATIVKTEAMDTSSAASSPVATTFPAMSKLAALRNTMASSLSTPSSPRSFKLPNTKDSLRFSTSSSSSTGSLKGDPAADMPHYIPSPLTLPKEMIAMPSPNWSAVDRKMQDVKTPRNLSAEVFDFLGPPPITPRNKLSSTGRDNSPSYIHGQKLSPRLNIPETPEDLSKSTGGGAAPSSSSSSRLNNHESASYAAEAEDLSMGGSKAASVSPPNSNSTPTPPPGLHPAAAAALLHPHHQLKQEYTPPTDDPMDSRSRHSSASGLGMEQQPLIKMETSDDYEPPYRPPSFGHPPPSSSAPPPPAANPFYLQSAPGQFNPAAAAIYHRMNLMQQQQQQHGGRFDQGGAHPPHPPPHYPAHLNWQGGQQQQQQPPSWHDHDEEASLSPPMHHQQHVQQQQQHHGAIGHGQVAKGQLPLISVNPPGTREPKKKAGRGKANGNNDPMLPGQKKRQKSKTPKVPPKDANGAKRVFSCPHCQRSYDWNYNLNRHLKYECNKENAFECSKCGRKFPHKQNCVYHLKRKHKIICDTIDQYVANGLVIFRGTAAAQAAAAAAASGSPQTAMGAE